MMNGLGLAVARNAIKRVHKRTGNLARSIEVTSVTDDRVTIGAKAAYARQGQGTPVRGVGGGAATQWLGSPWCWCGVPQERPTWRDPGSPVPGARCP
jgi:hypothetical protein